MPLSYFTVVSFPRPSTHILHTPHVLFYPFRIILSFCFPLSLCLTSLSLLSTILPVYLYHLISGLLLLFSAIPSAHLPLNSPIMFYHLLLYLPFLSFSSTLTFSPLLPHFLFSLILRVIIPHSPFPPTPLEHPPSSSFQSVSAVSPLALLTSSAFPSP